MAERVGLVVLNQFTAIGVVQRDGRVLPTREFLGFVTKLINRVGGDAPDVTLTSELSDIMAPIDGDQGDNYMPDIVIGDMTAIQAMVREMVAQEIAMQQQSRHDGSIAHEMTMGGN